MSNERNPNSGVWAVVGLAVAASIAAGGYWLYKNKDKVAELEKKAARIQRNLERWKEDNSSKFDQWQEDLEDWAGDISEKVQKNVSKVSKQIGRQIQGKVAEVKNQSVKATKNSNLTKNSDRDTNFELNSRQESMYQVVKKLSQATMPDFVNKVAGVTTRTLRRDLTKLQKLGLIEQVGKTKDSFYKLRK